MRHPGTAALWRTCGLALVLALALAVAVPAGAAGRIVDWKADAAGNQPAGWAIERFGHVREAQLRMGRDARGAAAQMRFASGDGGRPSASARFAVPFAPLRVYRITVEVSASAPVRAEVLVRRRAAPYDPMAIRSVALDERWQTVAMEATWPAGANEGDVRVQLRDSQGSVAVRRLTVDDEGPAPLGVPPAKPFPATLIGVHVNKFGRHTTWPAAGQGLVRLWDTGTTWAHLAPTAAEFDNFSSTGWKRLDALVDYVRNNRADATILYTLGMPPAWASSRPDAQCPYAKGACAAPASIEQWRHYVRTLAQRYQGRIRHWELWNEADYKLFYMDNGTLPMVELAKSASEELKRVDPQNRLLSPGYTNGGGLNALYAFLRDGGGRYVDIIGFHWYFSDRPEQLAGPMRNVRRLMEDLGAGGKPIWNTEGAPLCGRREGGGCTVGDLSGGDVEALTARAILTMWVNGVEAFAYYTVEGAGGRTPALLSEDYKGSTAAAAALRRLAQWMVGARAVAVTSWGRAGHAIECERDGKRFAIVWSELPDETLTLRPGWRAAERLDGGPSSGSGGGGPLGVGRIPVRVEIGRG